MAGPANAAALEGARSEIVELSERFSEQAGPVVHAALERRLEALLHARREWFGALAPDVAHAFRETAQRALDLGTEGVCARLRQPDLWLQPHTAPGVVRGPEHGWDGMAPEWITGFLRRFTRRQDERVLAELDDPGNRVWVALLSAAKPLDPVLREFGLEASSTPELGGGHYGIQPRTAAQLDPSGTLERLWKRYRLVYERYAALSRAVRTEG